MTTSQIIRKLYKTNGHKTELNNSRPEIWRRYWVVLQSRLARGAA